MKPLREIVNTGYLVPLIVLFLSLCMLANISAAAASDQMRVNLSEGNPFPNPERFGSAILVEVAGKRLLFDCGQGVVIRLAQVGVNPKEIGGLFLTHLHWDHLVGIPDLWLSGWFLGRDRSLPVWGRPQLVSWRSILLRHLVLISVFVRPHPILSPAKASKSMRKK